MGFEDLGLVQLLETPWVAQLAELAALLFACTVVFWIVRYVLVRLIRGVALRSDSRWDDDLVQSGLFERLSHIPPAFALWHGVQVLPHVHDTLEIIIRRVAVAFMVLTAFRGLSALLNATDVIYARNPENRDRPISAYLQVVKLVAAIVSAILILAALIDRSPLIFLSGLGAMAAVLLLIFRDTLLSLVASIQLTSYDMVHVGDWIEMPQFGADGDVIEVGLHTVKVQNFDKTITTIPTHKLSDGSFKNWRGMSRSGGRRIKRSVLIDVSSIRFLAEHELDDFARWTLLGDYIAEKREELAKSNLEEDRNLALSADIRRLTNLGTFRAYVERYLRQHPQIHKGMTLLVRQLPTTGQGLPMELYCFTNTTSWNLYEAIQADVFDHVLAILPEFGLRPFQAPSGHDLQSLAG